MSSSPSVHAPVIDNALVLLVDHDPGVRLSLARALESENYRVKLAADSDQLLGTLHQALPDLVLLDIDQPENRGWEAFERISALYPSLPIVLMTRRPHLDELACSAGAAGLIEKPLSVPVLVQRLHEVLETHSNRQVPIFMS